MSTVKLGVVGLGRLGRNHAANIHYRLPNAELTAICSVVQTELDNVAEEMKPRYCYTDYREMFKNQELDGVVIASNSQAHCEMACAAAELGVKNVYIFSWGDVGSFESYFEYLSGINLKSIPQPILDMYKSVNA